MGARGGGDGLWGWLNGLSLDVSLGAVGLASLCAQGLERSAPLPELVALWSAVSLMYSLDHLLDAHLQSRQAPPSRRLFHQQRQRTLRALSVSSALIGAVSLPYLQVTTVGVGGALGLCCGLYLWRTQRRAGSFTSRAKKASVALIYPIGVLTPSLAGLNAWEGALSRDLIMISLSVLSVTLANLTLFEVAERRTSGDPLMGEPRWRCWINALSLCPLIALLWRWLAEEERGGATTVSVAIIALIGLTHLALNARLHLWLERERYRRVADGAFLISWLGVLC